MLKTTADPVNFHQERNKLENSGNAKLLAYLRTASMYAMAQPHAERQPFRPRLVILQLPHTTSPGPCTHPVEGPLSLSPIGHHRARHGRDRLGVGRAHRARKVEHRPVDRRVEKSWNQDRGRSPTIPKHRYRLPNTRPFSTITSTMLTRNPPS